MDLARKLGMLVPMLFRWLFILVFACAVSGFGFVWYRKSKNHPEPYSFRDDFIHSILTPRFKYSAHHNDGGNRRIVPIMLMLSGPFILAVAWFRLQDGG
ncbi:MAG: hypothetical protein AAGJ56_04500 [Myxococcota bacterium]